jgi:pyruvate dehydrogenase E2 component (dihydrolipoamide acetyltransferase)
MKKSYSEAPHIHLDRAVAVGALEALRARLNDGVKDDVSSPARYTVTDFLLRAVALTLASNPLLNATLREGAIVTFAEANIGVAASTPRGLVVPVIRGCEKLSLLEIRDRRTSLVQRVRQGKQTPEDLSGGTFTITNLGMLGVDSFRPILNPGQSAILAAGAIRLLPVVEASGTISAQPIMQLCLGCDHRVVDGAEGARFLDQLTRLLEKPDPLIEA